MLGYLEPSEASGDAGQCDTRSSIIWQKGGATDSEKKTQDWRFSLGKKFQLRAGALAQRKSVDRETKPKVYTNASSQVR